MEKKFVLTMAHTSEKKLLNMRSYFVDGIAEKYVHQNKPANGICHLGPYVFNK